MYANILIYVSIFSILLVSCGGGSNSLISTLKEDALTRSVIIVKNASKAMAQSVGLANKSHIYKEEDLPSGLDCTQLGFTKLNRDINISLVGYDIYTRTSDDTGLKCETYDYKNFDKNISGELNKIFILSN